MGIEEANPTLFDANSLKGSVLNYVRQTGSCVIERTAPYWKWIDRRIVNQVLPYQRTADAPPGRELVVDGRHFLNFSSQDYLGLASDPRMVEAAARAAKNFGVHSAGSPAFCGSTRLLRELEDCIRGVVGGNLDAECVVLPTGWAAGYGVLVGLIRGDDLVLMDALAHNCLQEGARSCGGEVRKLAHNDLGQLEEILRDERAKNSQRGIFVVTESLYSMDSDSPDLGKLLDLC